MALLIAITVNSTGTLSAVGPDEADPSSGVLFTAGFELPTTFALSEGNVSGGTVTLSVAPSGSVMPRWSLVVSVPRDHRRSATIDSWRGHLPELLRPGRRQSSVSSRPATPV